MSTNTQEWDPEDYIAGWRWSVSEFALRKKAIDAGCEIRITGVHTFLLRRTVFFQLRGDYDSCAEFYGWEEEK